MTVSNSARVGSDTGSAIGTRIKDAREALSWSVEELARRMGVTVDTVNDWESCERDPRSNRNWSSHEKTFSQGKGTWEENRKEIKTPQPKWKDSPQAPWKETSQNSSSPVRGSERTRIRICSP